MKILIALILAANICEAKINPIGNRLIPNKDYEITYDVQLNGEKFTQRISVTSNAISRLELTQNSLPPERSREEIEQTINKLAALVISEPVKYSGIYSLAKKSYLIEYRTSDSNIWFYHFTKGGTTKYIFSTEKIDVKTFFPRPSKNEEK